MNMVSIIVPIYNSQQYIEACLDSILKQTYENYEVLLVDDGSFDDSGRICDYYAEVDCRFKVHHRQNQGVSASRNYGLAQATGEYILFVDADDTIEPTMLEDCIRLTEKNEAELVICSFRYYLADDNNRMVENSLKKETCVTENDLFDHWFSVLLEKEILNPPWNKLIKKDLLDTNRIRFNEEFSMCEDMMFSIQILDASKKTVLTGGMYYNYYLKSSGTLVFKFHENYYEALTLFYEAACHYCNKFDNNKTQFMHINTTYVNLIMWHIKQICTSSPWDRRTRYSKMKEIGRSQEFINALSDANLSRKRKIVCALLKSQQVYFIPAIYTLVILMSRITKESSRAIKRLVKFNPS